MGTNQLNIVQIDIEDLFGIYTYSIPMSEMDISKLLILYGENGAGKTIILQMIFNLLSCEKRKGYKSELANTKFKKISISLSNGYIVTAYRKNELIGNYYLSLIENKKDIIDILCNTIRENSSYVVRAGDDIDNFLNLLSNINLSIHYLSDDRKVKSNISVIINENSDRVEISEFPLEILRRLEMGEESFRLSDTLLQMAIQRVESWFKHQTLVANSIGQDSINSIYINLVENLLNPKTDSIFNKNEISKKKSVLDMLSKLDNKSKKFIEYKLTTNFNLNKLIDIIKKTPEEKIGLIENTLNPFINGINKKLDDIEKIKNIIDLFITTLNNFYNGKKFEFNIEDGLKIVSTYENIENLKPTMLSSGEKQLLLLFCNTITARESASIFIIDEPELSLNVVWQRKLIDTLLEFSEGSSIQFILATHSIELLTQYDENVSDLENKKVFK